MSVKKYIKKCVAIEAVKWTGTNYDEVKAFDPDCYWSHGLQFLYIPTLEGDMLANVGDYIIRGIKGEFYPCKPDIFALTYEEVPTLEELFQQLEE